MWWRHDYFTLPPKSIVGVENRPQWSKRHHSAVKQWTKPGLRGTRKRRKPFFSYAATDLYPHRVLFLLIWRSWTDVLSGQAAWRNILVCNFTNTSAGKRKCANVSKPCCAKCQLFGQLFIRRLVQSSLQQQGFLCSGGAPPDLPHGAGPEKHPEGCHGAADPQPSELRSWFKAS